MLPSGVVVVFLAKEERKCYVVCGALIDQDGLSQRHLRVAEMVLPNFQSASGRAKYNPVLWPRADGVGVLMHAIPTAARPLTAQKPSNSQRRLAPSAGNGGERDRMVVPTPFPLHLVLFHCYATAHLLCIWIGLQFANYNPTRTAHFGRR